MKLKILITGASGFVGINLLKKLSKNKNYKLFGVVNTKNPIIKKNVKYYRADLEKKKKKNKIKKKIEKKKIKKKKKNR